MKSNPPRKPGVHEIKKGQAEEEQRPASCVEQRADSGRASSLQHPQHKRLWTSQARSGGLGLSNQGADRMHTKFGKEPNRGNTGRSQDLREAEMCEPARHLRRECWLTLVLDLRRRKARGHMYLSNYLRIRQYMTREMILYRIDDNQLPPRTDKRLATKSYACAADAHASQG